MRDENTRKSSNPFKYLSFNDIATGLGRANIVIIITIISIVMAVSLAYVLILLFAEKGFPVFFALKLAAFIPLIIAPTLAWFLVGRHLKAVDLEKKLYFSATYDMLTGFLSRNGFFSNFQVVYEISQRNKTALSIATIDIDKFKKINDSYGHGAGDQVLRVFGDLVKNAVRKSDFIGRVGGDEFVLVLPYTALDEARNVSENIRQLVENTTVRYRSIEIKFSLSIGVAQVDNFMPVIIDEVLIKSDKALYEAKENGGNCVIANINTKD